MVRLFPAMLSHFDVRRQCVDRVDSFKYAANARMNAGPQDAGTVR